MTVLVSYQYHGLSRRVIENPGSAKDLFYSDRWQALEERVGTQVQSQNVWSPVYVDALVLRDRDADGNTGNGLEERLYVQHDANYNVTSILTSAGAVRERYVEDSYGKPSFLDATWG